MSRWLRRLLPARKKHVVIDALPTLERDRVEHLFIEHEGVPQVDWGMAASWIAHTEQDEANHASMHRAVAAAWLDELWRAVPTPSARWRRESVEGLAPVDAGPRLANATDRSLATITKVLKEIRGAAPISPIAVVALGTQDEYYDFISFEYPEEGTFTTSAGVYLRAANGSFPTLAINATTRSSVEETVAHELTHHALVGNELPLWAEEGLTQLMEERVTNVPNFHLDAELVERHRTLWDEIGLAGFEDGSTFDSTEGDEQELAYHLAQVLTRGLLTTRPNDFFAFARACRDTSAELAAHEHLGGTATSLAEAWLSGNTN